MARRIDTQAVIDAVRLEEQGSTPSTPASGYGIVYTTSSGPRFLDSSGNIYYSMIGGWINADETWTYAAADDPTYTLTISGDQTGKYTAGMRVRLSQTTGGTKYFIITKAAYSDPSTTLTLYGGTDYDLENEAISSPVYSWMKAPVGFPLSPLLWTVETKSVATDSQSSPTQNTWYNLGSLTISIPIGLWRVSYQCNQITAAANNTFIRMQTTLSTANNSESDVDFTAYMGSTDGGTTPTLITPAYREKYLSIASKTSYYLNSRTTVTNTSTIQHVGGSSPTIIRAVCAYL